MTNELIHRLQQAGIDVKIVNTTQIHEILQSYTTKADTKNLPERQQIESHKMFFSNAEHAAYSIRQEKATPAQWLAMLTKAGGIKAGEDKWLGLSEWLHNQTEPTLTKAQILDYIGLNRIALHENHYAELEQTEDFKKLDEEYRQTISQVEENYRDADEQLSKFYQEMNEKYDDGDYGERWMLEMDETERAREEELLELRDKYDTFNHEVEEIAFAEMVDKYGYHFDYAFSCDENGLTINDYEETKYFINAQAIESLRLENVTNGLTNYHEIALWAEQADSYATSDIIHFGDAGNGKCIGWIRFGETTVQVPLSQEQIEKNLAEMPKGDKWMKWSGEQFVAKHDLYYPPGVYSYYVKSPYISKGPRDEDEYYYHPLKGQAIACPSLQEAVNKYNREHVARTETKKVLVIDEVQSNRHQQANRKNRDNRKNGYLMTDDQRKKILDELAEANKQLVAYQDSMYKKYNSDFFGHYMTEAELKQLSILEQKPCDLMTELEKDQYAVPRAPFEKNWHELCMKRMLHYAAENGFDKVAWTKGEQQSARYNLAKHVNAIGRDKDHDKDKYVVIRYNNTDETGFYVKPDGRIFDSPTGWDGKHIDEVLGREMADKVLALPENTMLDVKDFRIGGKGMDAFYDGVLPNFMNRYVKQWGTSVSELALPHLTGQNDIWSTVLTMHSIDVTDQMKNSVQQGQPMFMQDRKGTLYGFSVGDTIFLTPEGLNPETVIHEYTHLWARAMKHGNPEGWQSVKELLRATTLWDEVVQDPLYTDIRHNDDYVASEALARISGRENAAKLAHIAQSTSEKAAQNGVLTNPADIFTKLKTALETFWSWVSKHMFDIERFQSVEEVTDRVLHDLLQAHKLILDEDLLPAEAEKANEGINSRISNITVYKGKNNEPYIRCKIDGMQQMGVPVKPEDRESAMNRDNLSIMAAKYFAKALNENPAREQGMKR